MKIAKCFSVIFGVVGSLIMIAAIGLCLVSLDADARIVEVPEEAELCAEAMVDAINSGDSAAAGDLMYGQPDLGAAGEPAEETGKMIWDAFRDSVSCELTGEYYMDGAVICRSGSVTALEIPSVTKNLQTRFRALLTERMEAAEDMAELYDENNDFRDELLSELLETAVAQALQEDAQIVTREITLELIRRDGQWWVVPDQTLLTALSGGLE